jgi:FkbM family methyltransferase
MTLGMLSLVVFCIAMACCAAIRDLEIVILQNLTSMTSFDSVNSMEIEFLERGEPISDKNLQRDKSVFGLYKVKTTCTFSELCVTNISIGSEITVHNNGISVWHVKIEEDTNLQNGARCYLVDEAAAKVNGDLVIFPQGGSALVHAGTTPGNRCFWCRVEEGKWEYSTFTVFRHFIKPHTTVIDIGSWIGPTALFAANLAHRVIAIEPCNLANEILTANVKLNPHLNIEVLLNCISSVFEVVTMRSNGILANSASYVVRGEGAWEGDWRRQYAKPVQCLPLPLVVTELKCKGPYFIKFDTEGFEAEIIPSLATWISDEHPTLFISMHMHIRTFTSQENISLASVLSQFSYLFSVNSTCERCGISELLIPVSTISSDTLCESCDYLATFEDPFNSPSETPNSNDVLSRPAHPFIYILVGVYDSEGVSSEHIFEWFPSPLVGLEEQEESYLTQTLDLFCKQWNLTDDERITIADAAHTQAREKGIQFRAQNDQVEVSFYNILFEEDSERNAFTLRRFFESPMDYHVFRWSKHDLTQDLLGAVTSTCETVLLNEPAHCKALWAAVDVQWGRGVFVALVACKTGRLFPMDLRDDSAAMLYGGVSTVLEAMAWGMLAEGINFVVLAPKNTDTDIVYPFPILDTGIHDSDTDHHHAVVTIFEQMSRKPDVVWVMSLDLAKILSDVYSIPSICTYFTSHPEVVNINLYPKILHRFVSFNMRASVVGSDDYLRDHSFALYHGIVSDELEFGTASDRKQITFITMEYNQIWKGLFNFCNLARMNPSERFVVYGVPTAARAYCTYNAGESIPDNMFFMGVASRDGIAQALRQSKVYVLLSTVEETFGRTVIEAASKGTPVLGNCYGALPELIGSILVPMAKNFSLGLTALSIADLNDNLHHLLNVTDSDRRAILEASKKRFHIDKEVWGMLRASRILLTTGSDGDRLSKLLLSTFDVGWDAWGIWRRHCHKMEMEGY